MIPGDRAQEPCKPDLDWLRREGLASAGSKLPTEEEWARSLVPPDEARYERMVRAPDLIVVHHSATLTGSCAHFRGLHVALFRWLDVAYHFVIGNGSYTRDGEVETGRPVWAVGAHARGHNDHSIGICLAGDFERQRPSTLMLRSLEGLLESLLRSLDLAPGSVRMHRELEGMNTLCPGRFFPRELLERLLPEA